MKTYDREEINRIKKSPWNFFVKHSRVTFLAIIIIIIWGLNGLLNLPLETEPEIDLPFGAIFTAYPGANPLDVEELVTNKIEKAVSNIEDIQELNSSSQLGISSVVVYFESDVDLDQAIDNLENEVNKVKPELPEEVIDPVISEFNVNAFPVIVFSLLSDLPDEEMQVIAKQVKDELEKETGISEVNIIGKRNKQIKVNLKNQLLERYGISINQVAASIQAANVNFPIGEITIDGYDYTIRLESAIKDSSELANIPILHFPDEEGVSQSITLKDIATIREELEEKNTIARVGLNETQNIQNSLSLQVYKKKGGNIVQVAENAKERMQELEGSTIPPSVTVHVANDNSMFVKEDLETLGVNGLQTIALIMLVLFIFLGFKESIISGMSIPFSMLITFGVVYMQGDTLNSLTLFSLVFALGLLIDNAIIIIEGIYENLKSKKYTPYGSAILGIYEFKWPIIAGTLTTVLAFFPIIFVSGIMGDFMRTIPITVTAILLASLFVNLSITPTIASKVLKPGKKRNLLKHIQSGYRDFIDNVIKSNFKKIVSILVMVIIFAVSVSLPVTGILKSEAFPLVDFYYFFVDIETPEGTTLKETEKIVSIVEDRLLTVPEIDYFTTSIGTNAGGAYRDLISVSQTQGNIGSITVNLVDQDLREKKSYDISKEVEELLKGIEGGKVSVVDLQGGPPSGAPIQARITGPDLTKLEEIALDVENKLKNIEGTKDPETDIKRGSGEFNITLNKNKLNYYGLSAAAVASLLRNALEGFGASEIRKDGEDIDVIIKYALKESQNGEKEIKLEDLENIAVISPTHGSVPVSSFTNIEFQENLSNIKHLDSERVVFVTSYVQDRTAIEVTNDLSAEIDKMTLPPGYNIEFGGEFEEVEQSFKDLGVAMLIGVILIFILLVLQFKSYSQPFIIILSLPFSLIGVFFGLTALGMTLNIPSVIGIVGLGGVVVNDAIVLIDQMNKNRKRGMQLHEAIVEGATSRLQPVFLTTVTSICGILPLALTNEAWGSLAFAFIFGLATQFFLVLLLDPIMYSFFSRKKKFGLEPRVHLEQSQG